MIKKIRCSIKKNKKISIVLIHGWGLNSNIWINIIPILKKYCTIYLIDLPGYKKNVFYPTMNFYELSQYLLYRLPKKVIWIGWSMGGLIANYIGLNYPKRTHGIITITSSPYFIQEKNWPGTTLFILKEIKKKIFFNYKYFLKNFLSLHNTKKNSKKKKTQKIFHIKNFFQPNKESIKYGYKWLTEIDQRKDISFIQVPLLTIYGKLDNMVPVDISKKMYQLCKKNYSYVISKSKHAPFLSHPIELCSIIKKFIKNFYFN